MWKGSNIMAKTKYPTLLSPAKIGNVEIRNRTIMAAMGMSQSDNGFVNKATINHYAARAKGGVGAIIVEVTCVDSPLGLNTKGMLVIDDDKYIPGMADLAAAIHDGGAKAFLQISHTGRGARRAIISPSTRSTPLRRSTPRPPFGRRRQASTVLRSTASATTSVSSSFPRPQISGRMSTVEAERTAAASI